MEFSYVIGNTQKLKKCTICLKQYMAFRTQKYCSPICKDSLKKENSDGKREKKQT